MKINGNQVRPGNVLEHQGRLWRVMKTEHVKPGKGGAFAQVEMKDIVSGTKLNERFRATESVERATLEQRPMQFLYADGETLYFMDNSTYEQTEIPAETFGDQLVWLQENMEVLVEVYEGKPMGAELPPHVVMEIIEADAVVKGQTQSSSYKPAKVENGETVLVPPFIEAGIRIKINTLDGTYVERA